MSSLQLHALGSSLLLMEIPLAQILAGSVGVLSHVAYFNRGEHHLYPGRYPLIFLSLCLTGVILCTQVAALSLDQALSEVAALAGWYFSGLYSTLIIYRSFFSPLRNFPGPFWTKISGFWFTLRVRKLDAHKQVERLHQQYGPFVRTGPNSLSIAHPKAVDTIYGHGSRCRKAPFYDMAHPMTSLAHIRQPDVHSKRRRVWSSAFGEKSLRHYETRIKRYQDTLLERLAEMEEKPFTINKWFAWYSSDVMSDLAFGRSFGSLEARQPYWMVNVLEQGTFILGLMLPMWLFRFLANLQPNNDFGKMITACHQKLEERMKIKVAVPDIMSTLLQPFDALPPSMEDLNFLRGDAAVLIIAGSESTAVTLVFILSRLLRHPEHLERVRTEVGALETEADELSDRQLAKLPHFNAVISETQRVFALLPTYSPRMTPSEGLAIEGTFVPGGTEVTCPLYLIHRDESAFPRAKEFIPERWYTQPELVKDASAFAPFSAGVYGCIGRPLAMISLRMVLAKILLTFDISLAPGEPPTRVEDEALDHYDMIPGPLNVVLWKR